MAAPTSENEGGTRHTVLPFHLRAQQELAAFAMQVEAAKARKARLEKVLQIGSREEARQQEQAAIAAAATKERAETAAKEIAEARAGGARESKWGLKRSRDGDGSELAYGGAVV
eukprot:COSAG05_NODE_14201_length_404_cov_1.022951_1_plen_113_part_01